MRSRDQRAHLRLRIERVADLHAPGELGHPRDDLVVDRGLDEQARARLARLPGRIEDRPGRARDRVVEIGVGEDDVRALAAELERHALERVGSEAHHLGAGRGRAGERDLVDARVAHEVRADRRSVAGNDVDDAVGNADLVRQLGEPERRQRRLRIRLEHDRAAGRERGRELPRREHQRVVPRHDLTADADRLLQRVEEQRAADRIRASGDRADRTRVEAEVLDRLRELGLHRRDRLADVARLELRELLAVGDERVCESVQQARALGRARLAPVAFERGARGLDRLVDVRPRSRAPPPPAARRSPARRAGSSAGTIVSRAWATTPVRPAMWTSRPRGSPTATGSCAS